MLSRSVCCHWLARSKAMPLELASMVVSCWMRWPLRLFWITVPAPAPAIWLTSALPSAGLWIAPKRLPGPFCTTVKVLSRSRKVAAWAEVSWFSWVSEIAVWVTNWPLM
jgi:hypothetical protein